ncbi:hypothetical protein CRENPOLYSF2_180004 [Crenothrix polyspora]|uniref:Glycoside-hydrolase family GH114 TIM-barrel domain-containing protein n=1 Tax=Crenothrix polyspora TaxID=360316 RepID=A0A1R4H3C2_9GAMM|nr:putative glycoside hydrolase [Crenothrix polyspora]SJM90719.1 hypothetical protein CRENPOLYSF2_180004 [Crenothrix polyspora]
MSKKITPSLSALSCFLFLVLVCVYPLHAYQAIQSIEGKIRFFKHANTTFDSYSAKPDTRQQKWMQSHYQRMLAYTPYFDARLAWYPNAWFYMDSYAIYVDSETAKKHPEWILRDEKNNVLYIPWECNGKCDQYAGDFGNPEFRKFKIEEIRAGLGKGYRGVWLDDVNLTWRVGDNKEQHITPVDRRTGKLMALKDWQRYFAEFMEDIRAAFPNTEITHNAIWYADTMEVENPLVSRQISAANYINIERGGNDSGLTNGDGQWGYPTFLRYMDYVHQRGAGVILMDTGATPDEREYGLATALLISNGNDLISSNQPDWTTPDHWWSGYDVNLGAALNTRYTWRGLLRRDFECGQVLVNQPNMPEQLVKLEGGFQRIDGSVLKKMQLAGKSAVILLKPCKPH